MNKAQAGRKGGKATLKKYGRDHFKALNAAWHAKYKWQKLSTSDFALTLRKTGEATGKTMKGVTL